MNKMKQRGISTIVGGLIFTILMLGTFSALSLALDFQTELVDVQQSVADKGIKKTRESFSISAITDENNLLNLYVGNNGQNPLEITSVWILNKTDPSKTATMYETNHDESYVPAGHSTKILKSSPVNLNSGEYEIKVVSALGNIEKTALQVNETGATELLRTDIFMVPPEILTGQNATLAMLVTNIGDMEILNVTASVPTITPSNAVKEPLPENTEMVSLKPKDSKLFKWDYKFNGTSGTLVTFTNNASGILQDKTVFSNTASDSIILSKAGSGDGSEDTIVIKDELFAKPETFMVIPSPFGDSEDSQGLWGVNVANPTNKTMTVSKITISILYPGANDNNMFLDAGCPVTEIFPTDGNWSCPNQNQLVWQNLTNPITIPPLSVTSFLAKAEPDRVTGATEGLDTAVVHAGIFTTLGAFGKTQYETSITKTGDVIANVYLSDEKDSIDPTKMRGSRTNIPAGSIQTFNILLADLAVENNTMQDGTQLIINIPKEWEFIQIVDNTGFSEPLTINEFPDGSSQIIGSLQSPLDNAGKTIQFEAKAPSPSSEKMYVMHVLANGETSSGRPVGPVAEIVLQVDP